MIRVYIERRYSTIKIFCKNCFRDEVQYVVQRHINKSQKIFIECTCTASNMFPMQYTYTALAVLLILK